MVLKPFLPFLSPHIQPSADEAVALLSKFSYYSAGLWNQKDTPSWALP